MVRNMAEVNWIIDAEMFDGYREELVASIRRQGHGLKLIRPPQPPYRWDDVDSPFRDTFPPDACVIALGDIAYVQHVARESQWAPAAFASVEKFACSSYYCEFGKYLLNGQYVMLPFGELERCQDFLFESVGQNGAIFVRPDSPLKLFTGQVVTRDSFSKDLDYMGFYEFPKASLVVASTPRSIVSEWRFVIADGRVVTGSLYRQDGEKCVQAGYDEAAGALAAEIAQLGYQPDPVWVMDICRTNDGTYHMLEIGGFSFADLYAGDKDAIVEAASREAAKIWNASRPRRVLR
jgi:hypothetical protein